MCADSDAVGGVGGFQREGGRVEGDVRTRGRLVSCQTAAPSDESRP